MKKEELAALKIDATLHEDPSLAELPDVAALAKSYVETKRLVGGSIRIPGKDAGEADVKVFREKMRTAVPDLIEVPADPVKFAEVEGMLFERLGRPKDVKEYPALKDMKIEIPEEIKINEEELRATAHKFGWTKKQFAEFGKQVIAEKVAAAQVNSEARKALRTELGDAFDDRLLAAAHAAQKMGADEATVTAIRTGNIPPARAKEWIAVAKAIGANGAEFKFGEGGGGVRMTPAEAQAQIDELRRNPALNDRNHPEQKRLAAKLADLYKVLYPS